VSDEKKPFHNPFEALRGKLGDLPEGPAAKTQLSKLPKGPARAVVRMERKGRGGKEVTLVEQLDLPQKDLGDWLKALKSSLGCGGAVEGVAIVLQGDHRKRLPAILEARGVRKVIVS
jgi:translation initiation factor 1